MPALCFGCFGGYRALFVDFVSKLKVGAMPLGSTCILCAALCGVSEHQSQDTLRSWDTLRSQIHLVPIKET